MLWRTVQELAFDLAKIRSDCEAEIEAINRNRDLVEAVIKNDIAVLAKAASSDVALAKRYADGLVEHADPIARIPVLKLTYLDIDTTRKHREARERRDRALLEHQRQVNTIASYWQQRTAYSVH